MRKIGEENMRADYIKGIIKNTMRCHMICILINGTWGIGKTYVLKETLKEKCSFERNYRERQYGMMYIEDYWKISD